MFKILKFFILALVFSPLIFQDTWASDSPVDMEIIDEDESIAHELAVAAPYNLRLVSPVASLIESYEEKFNLAKFRKITPQKLPEIKEEVDLHHAFIPLLSRICLTNETHPFYLHVSTIKDEMKASTPRENQEKIRALKAKFLLTLKLLQNKTLSRGEEEKKSETWAIHEEDKPEIINTLKHIAIALKSEFSARSGKFIPAMGMLLNGGTECSTGISEALNSLTNFLIWRKHNTSTGLEEIVENLASQAVEEAFHKAFAPSEFFFPPEEGERDENTHDLSACRQLLFDVIGVSRVLRNFEERICVPTDEESEEIITEFFNVFTPDFFIKAIQSKVQSQEDLNLDLKIFEEKARATNESLKRGVEKKKEKERGEIREEKKRKKKTNKIRKRKREEENSAIPSKKKRRESESKHKKRLKRMKEKQKKNREERPISVNLLAPWILDHSHLRKIFGENKEGLLNFYGLSSEGNKTLTKEGIEYLLQDLGYFPQ